MFCSFVVGLMLGALFGGLVVAIAVLLARGY